MVTQITITDIDSSNRISFGAGVGCQGNFSCPMVSGSALIVSSDESRLATGASLAVSTDHDVVDNFRAALSGAPPYVRPLKKSGSFEVRGVVKRISGDVIQVAAGDLEFSLSILDTEGDVPSPGQTCEFNVHGLSLWDQGR